MIKAIEVLNKMYPNVNFEVEFDVNSLVEKLYANNIHIGNYSMIMDSLNRLGGDVEIPPSVIERIEEVINEQTT